MTVIYSNKNKVEVPDYIEGEKIYSTLKSPEAIGPYSTAFWAGDFLFCSGQLGVDPKTGILVEGGIIGQTRQACLNIAIILRENGLSLKDVVKTTIFLKDIADFQVVNDIYKDYFVLKPARSCVEVANIPKDAMIEIEVIAYKNKKK